VLAPFGLADPALELMASALDLIAAIGHTFGVRPEAVRALPQPPDAAFVLCVLALLWGALWRGAIRWGGIAFFAASIALYLEAPRPVAGFDADLRAIYARAEQGEWTLIAGRGRSTFARDRLGAMLGISPPAIERLAPPEACGEAMCTWRTPGGGGYALVRGGAGFATACRAGLVVIASLDAPEGYAHRCGLRALIDGGDLLRLGGGLIYETPTGPRIERARPEHIRRAWTPRGPASAQE
jgi:hypothetical protein